MKTLRQSLRQPIKTLIGILLMTLAASILCVCVGQAMAAQSTKADLDRRFSTVGVPSQQEGGSGMENYFVEQELLDWIDAMSQEHPELVKGMVYHGILSAYSPQLKPYNPYAEGESLSTKSIFFNEPAFNSVMLTFTLSQIEEPVEQTHWFSDNSSEEDFDFISGFVDTQQTTSAVTGYHVQLVGTVSQIVSLPDGLRDPTGMNVRITLTVPTLEALESLDLEVGGQYIAYALDYHDLYKDLIADLAGKGFGHVAMEPYDSAKLKVPTEDQIKRFKRQYGIDTVMLYNGVPLDQRQYEMLNSIALNMEVSGGLIEYEALRNEAGELLELIPKTQVTYTDGSGQTVTVGKESHDACYAVPTIARLTEDPAAFLASPQGHAWQAALERDEVNRHAFTVIGVDGDIDYLGAFALEKSTIGKGREFTPEEIAGGARVCLVHELVAQNAGLQIGDTITLSYYNTDYALPFQENRATNNNLFRPVASFYFDTTPFIETVEYTIVGFWQGDAWPDDRNLYSFNANTVFVPRTAVQTPMEDSNCILYVSAALENGTIDQFYQLAKRSGYAGRFKFFDQDYSEIAGNFHNYEDLAREILTIGAVVYGILLLLFLLLYPATQKKTVRTMETMGCGFLRRWFHVLVSSMAVVLPASVLGGVVGSKVWDRVVTLMQTTAETTLALQIESGTLERIVVAQCLLALLCSAFAAIFVAAPRGMGARR